jgi:Secretion system C-terminal sorting domain
VKNATEGTVQFTLDATENFDENQNVYIHDNVTNEYHEISNGNFDINLPIGTFETRFSLRFTNSALGVDDFDLNKEILVTFTSNNDTITINNAMLDATIQSVDLFNILGQSIESWDMKNSNQKKIQIPVSTISTGTYIVKVHTSKGEINKKIIID